ncbi:alpha/beta hydrolase [Seohaeicola nanhaiensis]|uniref:Alpha/beta hydrolase n=1 Tax=Seohaeicola nanhaiensis TaxID=1387282 RepID=A0ABV9KDJ8_9RHOB
MTIRSGASLRLVLAILLLVAACSRPPDLIGIDNPQFPALKAEGVSQNTIFIATTRASSELAGTFFSDRRHAGLNLASVTVTVPPGHVPGQIERAKRLPPDPGRDFTVVGPEVYDRDSEFVTAIDAALAQRPPQDRNILVFIHGYNNTLSDSVLRIAQFVNDTGFKGVPVLFSWASAGKVTHYVYDLNSALVARPALEQTSALLIRTKASGFDVFAHSMGSFVTMETLLRASIRGELAGNNRLRNVMLAAPDIDMDLFRSQLAQMKGKLGNVFVFVSRGDRALGFSRRISGGVVRVGAADAAELEGLGVTVIDLSLISSDTTHDKFANSPAVVQLIGQSLNKDNFEDKPGTPTLVEVVRGIPILRELVVD